MNYLEFPAFFLVGYLAGAVAFPAGRARRRRQDGGASWHSLDLALLQRVALFLSPKDRVSLALASRALLDASHGWFMGARLPKQLAGNHPDFLARVAWANERRVDVSIQIVRDEWRFLSSFPGSLCVSKLKILEVAVPGPILHTLPEGLLALTSLTRLEFNQADIADCTGVSRLSRLERLTINDDDVFTTVPPELERMTSLRQLDLSRCFALKAPQHLPAQLERLELEMSGGEVPEVFTRLTRLTHLSFSTLQDRLVPLRRGWQHLRPLVTLKFLELYNLGLHAVPAAITSLTSLTHLSLAHNPLDTLFLERRFDDDGWLGVVAAVAELGRQGCPLYELSLAECGIDVDEDDDAHEMYNAFCHVLHTLSPITCLYF